MLIYGNDCLFFPPVIHSLQKNCDFIFDVLVVTYRNILKVHVS